MSNSSTAASSDTTTSTSTSSITQVLQDLDIVDDTEDLDTEDSPTLSHTAPISAAASVTPAAQAPVDDDIDAESSEDDEDIEEETKKSWTQSIVQLGFGEEPEHPGKMLRHQFPSKVGGRPAWLAPPLSSETSPSDLTCSQCKQPLKFLLQLYAPLRELPSCFHRSLFVFLCSNGRCLSHPGSIVILRSQLPLVNPFYPNIAPPKLGEWPEDEDIPVWEDVPFENFLLCRICGIPGPNRCARCHSTSYCSRAHQILDWKCAHKQECNQSNIEIAKKQQYHMARISCLFPQQEIVIEDEEYTAVDQEDDYKLEKKLLAEYKREAAKLTDKEKEEEESEFDDKIWRSLKKKDRFFTQFQNRIKKNSEQIIRYVRDVKVERSEPLWVSSLEQIKHEQVPPCPYCQQPRHFEFQILPQLVYFLESDSRGADALDWGTIVVYTCKNSCGDGTKQYFKEFVHMQPHNTNE